MTESFPIRTATDSAILMHREVHFGGDFSVMIDYYERGGKGIFQEFELEQIRHLAEVEVRAKQNLAVLILTGPEVEKVARAKESYKRLRDLFDDESTEVHYARLLADLILSEEEEPREEIVAIVKEKGAIVPAILEVLRAADLHDPLFPGYGKAPSLAAKCLGLIGDKRAIISLFELIGEGDFYDENMALEGLKAIGEPAKEFLLNVVHGRPLDFDNERAATALLAFKDDPEVSKFALQMLQEPEVRTQIPLATYLTLICEGLTDPTNQKTFSALANDPLTPKSVVQDIRSISKDW